MVFCWPKEIYFDQTCQNDNFMRFLAKLMCIYMAWLPWQPDNLFAPEIFPRVLSLQ